MKAGRDLSDILAALRELSAAVDDAERIDRIRLLEELKSTVAAVQAKETAAFVASQRAAQRAAGVPADRVGRGVAAQVGLARRVSPYQARRYVGWTTTLTSELPATFAALRAGRVSEWRAMIVARETIWLSREHRLVVDAELAPRLERLGDRQVEAETRKLGYALDPRGFIERIANAESERRVGIRPAPDVMARLTALLPAARAVAAYAALAQHADSVTAAGDTRGRGQIMADTLVERLTGQTCAADVPVEINLIMTDQTLFGDESDVDETTVADEPAHLDGYGPVPAELARRLAFGPSDDTPMWLRRLFTRSGGGELAAMDSRRRLFTATQRHFLRLRDQSCRQPYCDASIRHTDHIVPAEAGGSTSITNARGTCAACNYAKEAPGWHTVPTGSHGEYVITTPTGHRYPSRPPDPPGAGRPRARSPVERMLADLIFAA